MCLSSIWPFAVFNAEVFFVFPSVKIFPILLNSPVYLSTFP